MVDIAEMGYLKGSHNYLFICIDIFSKFAYGIDMPKKDSNSSSLILKDVF